MEIGLRGRNGATAVRPADLDKKHEYVCATIHGQETSDDGVQGTLDKLIGVETDFAKVRYTFVEIILLAQPVFWCNDYYYYYFWHKKSEAQIPGRSTWTQFCHQYIVSAFAVVLF